LDSLLSSLGPSMAFGRLLQGQTFMSSRLLAALDDF